MKFQAINSPKGDRNRFCGPAVVSAVTGMTTGGAARLIRQLCNKPLVAGTTSNQLASAFNACGINMRRVSVAEVSDAPTFAQWVKQPREAGRIYLIVIGNHWAVVRGLRYICGIVKEPVPFNHPGIKRRARVTEVYMLVERPSGLVIPPAATKPKAKPANKARRAFTAFANSNNIDWELTYRGCQSPMVWGVLGVDIEDDPWEGDHQTECWEEALSRAKEYARLAAA